MVASTPALLDGFGLRMDQRKEISRQQAAGAPHRALRSARTLRQTRRSTGKSAGFLVYHDAGHELPVHRQIQAHQVTVKRKLKVLALFDAMSPTTLDQDLQTYLKVEDRKTEADVLKALGQLGHTTEHLAI